MEVLDRLSEAIQEGRTALSNQLVAEALRLGITPDKILNEALLPGILIIGNGFRENKVFVPQVLLCSRALKASLTLLKPHFVNNSMKPAGKVVIGTVEGDLHDIGKKLVGIMLMGAGFEVIDLGVNVPVEKFITAIIEHNPDILALSALLTTTMEEQARVIKELEKSGLRSKVMVMVGGAPVTEEYAKSIGADAYSCDAYSAAETAKRLCQCKITIP